MDEREALRDIALRAERATNREQYEMAAAELIRAALAEAAPPPVDHVDGPGCWCQPVLDYEDPVTGGRVYVHRRTIDGPAYEKEHAV